MRLDRRGPRRSGKILILAILLMPVLLGILAMSVDIGVLAAAQAKLRTVSDAGALAGAMQLATEQRVRGTALSNDTLSAIRTRVKVVATSRGNEVLQQAVVVNDSALVANEGGSTNTQTVGDVQVGYLNTSNRAGGFSIPADTLTYNSVKFTASRDASHLGPIPAYFGQALGISGLDARTTSIATCQPYAISGFKTVNAQNSGILPIALDEDTYDAMLSGSPAQATDNYYYNPATSTVVGSPSMATSVSSAGFPGGDGVYESALYPVGHGYGNWGTLNIGVSNNSTSILRAQIQDGITPEQMATYPNATISAPLDLSGNPGISAGIKSALVAIIGQVRAVPLYSGSPTGQGNNMTYRIVGFGAIRVLDVRFQGNPKYVVVQPALMKDATAVAGVTRSWTQGGVVRVRLTQ